MTILIDMDDTMEQLLQAWLECVNTRYGRNVAYTDIQDWDITKAYPGLTREQVYGVVLENDFWKTVKPMPHAQEVIQYFMEQGHQVLIVTASSYESLYGKMAYHLFHHFPFLSWDQVIITSRKQLIRGDVLIDDGPHNLEGGSYHKILVSCPHNRGYDEKAQGMLRVDNWLEIREAVDRLVNTGKLI